MRSRLHQKAATNKGREGGLEAIRHDVLQISSYRCRHRFVKSVLDRGFPFRRGNINFPLERFAKVTDKIPFAAGSATTKFCIGHRALSDTNWPQPFSFQRAKQATSFAEQTWDGTRRVPSSCRALAQRSERMTSLEIEQGYVPRLFPNGGERSSANVKTPCRHDAKTIEGGGRQR